MLTDGCKVSTWSLFKLRNRKIFKTRHLQNPRIKAIVMAKHILKIYNIFGLPTSFSFTLLEIKMLQGQDDCGREW